MRRRLVGLFSVFFIVALILSLANAYAKSKHIEITSAFSDDIHETLFIYGENFGDSPQVTLEWELLTVHSFTDDYIEAALPVGIEPGSYRLAVARGGRFNSTDESDTMDVTIDAVGPIGPEGPEGPAGPGTTASHLRLAAFEVVSLAPGDSILHTVTAPDGAIVTGPCYMIPPQYASQLVVSASCPPTMDLTSWSYTLTNISNTPINDAIITIGIVYIEP
jgi:hypothetical protein